MNDGSNDDDDDDDDDDDNDNSDFDIDVSDEVYDDNDINSDSSSENDRDDDGRDDNLHDDDSIDGDSKTRITVDKITNHRDLIIKTSHYIPTSNIIISQNHHQLILTYTSSNLWYIYSTQVQSYYHQHPMTI